MSTTRVDGVTRRYAGALFELAFARGALDAVQADVERLGRELSSPAIGAYLFDTRVPHAERRSKLEPVLAGMHQLMQNFVGLLFDKRREAVLLNLSAAFHERRLLLDRAAEGVVESAVPLGEAELSKLAAALSRVMDKTLHLENRVTPDLIAGVRVVADNRMIDFSARGRLDGLRRTMLSSPLPSAASSA